MRERRISTPLVLTLASTMVTVGVVAFLATRSEETPPAKGESPPVDLDARTPERAAESFLDAWRKRAHDVALELSTGAAEEAVRRRRARDLSLTEEEYAIKGQLWDPMAQDRLAFRVEQSDSLSESTLRLSGVAEGSFLGEPYRRRVTFTLEPHEDRWLVSEMILGEILTEAPQILEQAGTE